MCVQPSESRKRLIALLALMLVGSAAPSMLDQRLAQGKDLAAYVACFATQMALYSAYVFRSMTTVLASHQLRPSHLVLFNS